MALAFAALEMIQCLKSDLVLKETKYFNANPKSLDYKVTGKKDEHRYGVELKENKQFHHTKTGLELFEFFDYCNKFTLLTS